MIKTVNTDSAPAAIGPYTQAKIVGDLIFTSGQIPIDPTTGNSEAKTIEEQTEQICKNLSAVLTAAGSSLKLVIKTTCYLSDMADFSAFNDVYARYFTEKPARSCVAVKALPKGALAEIEAIARVSEK